MAIVKTQTLRVISPLFRNNEYMPEKYSCEGDGINPPLRLEEIPEGTISLALIVEDPDAPGGTFVHWVVWNIEPQNEIEEDSIPGRVGRNAKQENKYHPACPPPGRPHHYHFKVFALDTELNLPENADKSDLMRAMQGHVIGEGELVGLYMTK